MDGPDIASKALKRVGRVDVVWVACGWHGRNIRMQMVVSKRKQVPPQAERTKEAAHYRIRNGRLVARMPRAPCGKDPPPHRNNRVLLGLETSLLRSDSRLSSARPSHVFSQPTSPAFLFVAQHVYLT